MEIEWGEISRFLLSIAYQDVTQNYRNQSLDH